MGRKSPMNSELCSRGPVLPRQVCLHHPVATFDLVSLRVADQSRGGPGLLGQTASHSFHVVCGAGQMSYLEDTRAPCQLLPTSQVLQGHFLFQKITFLVLWVLENPEIQDTLDITGN